MTDWRSSIENVQRRTWVQRSTWMAMELPKTICHWWLQYQSLSKALSWAGMLAPGPGKLHILRLPAAVRQPEIRPWRFWLVITVGKECAQEPCRHSIMSGQAFLTNIEIDKSSAWNKPGFASKIPTSHFSKHLNSWWKLRKHSLLARWYPKTKL